MRIGGLFTLGPSFGVDGNLLVSDSTFLRINPNTRPADMIDIGLISLKPGANAEKVLKNLQANLPSDVQVFTRQGFIDFEKNYWLLEHPLVLFLT